MSMKKRYAAVFVHGLAKKPAPPKLEEIWLWGLGRDDPNGDVFPNPNPGIDLTVEGVPFLFNYYADVFYGEDYEAEFGSYYESSSKPRTRPRYRRRTWTRLREKSPRHVQRHRESSGSWRNSSAAERAAVAADRSPARPRPKAQVPGQFEIASWLPGPVKEAIIKKAAMEATTSSLTRSTSALTANDSRSAASCVKGY